MSLNFLKNNKINLKENTKNEFLISCVETLKKRQEKLMKQFNFGHEGNNFLLLPNKNNFYLFNDSTKKIFFEAKIQVIGTYSDKSRTWRWGWSNRYTPANCKKTSLKIMDFGKANGIEMLSQPKIKGENMGYIFTAIGMVLSNSRGYYIIPSTKVYPEIYLVFNSCKKVDLDYFEVNCLIF